MHYFNNLKIDIHCVDRVVIREHWENSPTQLDPFNRFYYIVRGNADIGFKGKTLRLKEGMGYILPAGTKLHLRQPKEVFEQLYIHFNATLPGGIELFSFLDCPVEIAGEVLQKQLPKNWLDWFLPEKSADVLVSLNQEALLRLLLNPFISAGVEKAPEKQDAMVRFEPIIKYIDRNCHKQIKIKKLADMVFLQPTYFSNTFSKVFGVAPQRYICQVRVNKAQHLLEHSDQPVKEIAEQVGYDDELYFSRLFKNYVGMPPTVYRQQRKLNPY